MFGAKEFARAAGRHVFRALAAAGGQPQLLLPTDEEPLTGTFADAMAELVSGVCIVTAAGRDGSPYGLLATSLCSYSCSPPTILVCLGREGRARSAVASAPAFAAHVLCDQDADIAHWFSTNGSDRFAAIDWDWDEGVPALAQDHVVAYLRCERARVVRHGDHAIIFGRVAHVETAPGEPLIYLRRRMDWRLESA